MSAPLLRSKMRKRPLSKRKTTPRPFIIPVQEKTPTPAKDSPDSESEEPEVIVLDSSTDVPATASPAKRRSAGPGRPRKGSWSPDKQAGPEQTGKRRSTSASSEGGRAGPSRSPAKGHSSSRHSGQGRGSVARLGEHSDTPPRPGPSPLGGEKASGKEDRPETGSLRKSPAVHQAPEDRKSAHRRSKLPPRKALDFELPSDKGEAPLTPKETLPRVPRSSASPPVDGKSPLLGRMSLRNVTSFEPLVHSTPIVPSRKALAGEASALLVEDFDSPESAASETGGQRGPAAKQAEPPVFGDLPTTRHAQHSLLEALRLGGKARDAATPRASVKRPSPQNRSSKRTAVQVPAKQKKGASLLARVDDFVECPVEEDEEEMEAAEEDKEAATSAAALSSYKELLSFPSDKHSGSARGSLPKRGRPEEPKSGASGSSGLRAASPGGHEAQDAGHWDRPSTSRGHRSSPRVVATSQEGAGKATKTQKKKKKKRQYVAIQVYQPKGVERSKCDVTAFDVFLTLAMEVIDDEIEQCQSEEGKRDLGRYKQYIIEETGKIIEELQVYTSRLHEVEKERRNLRSLRKKIEEAEEKLVRCIRENGLDIDPYQFLWDGEGV